MSKDFKWESITALSSLAVALIAVIAAAFTVQQIRDFREATKIQRLVEESREFESRYLNVRRNLALNRLDSSGKLQTLDPSNPPPELYDILNYCDYLGLLYKRGYLDAEDIWDVFGYWLENFYADSMPVIRQEQKDSPNTYKNFEALIAVIQAIDKQRGESTQAPSSQDLADFYTYEAKRTSGLIGENRSQTRSAHKRELRDKAKPTHTAAPQ